MKNWSSIKWNIHAWFWYHSWIYINTLTTKKCYREWKKVKKYINKPHWKLTRTWPQNFSLFRLEIRPLEWKLKYDECRWEENPMITLSVFGHNWRWELIPDNDSSGENVDLQYWETVLWMDKFLKKYDNPAQAVHKAIKFNTWQKYDSKTPVNVVHMLTTLGRHLYDTWDSSKKKK